MIEEGKCLLFSNGKYVKIEEKWNSLLLSDFFSDGEYSVLPVQYKFHSYFFSPEEITSIEDIELYCDFWNYMGSDEYLVRFCSVIIEFLLRNRNFVLRNHRYKKLKKELLFFVSFLGEKDYFYKILPVLKFLLKEKIFSYTDAEALKVDFDWKNSRWWLNLYSYRKNKEVVDFIRYRDSTSKYQSVSKAIFYFLTTNSSIEAKRKFSKILYRILSYDFYEGDNIPLSINFIVDEDGKFNFYDGEDILLKSLIENEEKIVRDALLLFLKKMIHIQIRTYLGFPASGYERQELSIDDEVFENFKLILSCCRPIEIEERILPLLDKNFVRGEEKYKFIYSPEEKKAEFVKIE